MYFDYMVDKESSNEISGYMVRNCTIRVAKAKALISFAVLVNVLGFE